MQSTNVYQVTVWNITILFTLTFRSQWIGRNNTR